MGSSSFFVVRSKKKEKVNTLILLPKFNSWTHCHFRVLKEKEWGISSFFLTIRIFLIN